MIPSPYDPSKYRERNPDLRRLTDEELLSHWNLHGRAEGRDAGGIRTSEELASFVIGERVLEVGAFYGPRLSGENVKYADWLDRDALVERAMALGFPEAAVPAIDIVLSESALSDYPCRFDAVYSSNVVEHAPDLVAHLVDVTACLKPGGRYFCAIPDLRYCFDRFISPSTIADVLDAYSQRSRVHSLKNVILHRCFTTVNDPKLHWDTPDLPAPEADVVSIVAALDEYADANDEYIDVHAWFFTPITFSRIMEAVSQLDLVDLVIEEIFHTPKDSPEFFVVLVKDK